MEPRLEIVLLADSAQRVHQEVADYMAAEGFDVRGFHQVEPFAAHLRAGAGDAIVLSLDHVEDAHRLVQDVRGMTSKPIILLQHPGGSQVALDLLELGADDFVCRDVDAEDPIALREFRVRLTTSLRRAALGTRADGDLLTVGDIVADTRRRTVHRGGRPLDLTRIEYLLLIRFMANPEAVLLHDELLRDVWSENQTGERQYLRTYTSRLRRKLGWTDSDERDGPRIVAVPGRGYCLRLRPDPADAA